MKRVAVLCLFCSGCYTGGSYVIHSASWRALGARVERAPDESGYRTRVVGPLRLWIEAVGTDRYRVTATDGRADGPRFVSTKMPRPGTATGFGSADEIDAVAARYVRRNVLVPARNPGEPTVMYLRAETLPDPPATQTAPWMPATTSAFNLRLTVGAPVTVAGAGLAAGGIGIFLLSTTSCHVSSDAGWFGDFLGCFVGGIFGAIVTAAGAGASAAGLVLMISGAAHHPERAGPDLTKSRLRLQTADFPDNPRQSLPPVSSLPAGIPTAPSQIQWTWRF